MRILSVCFSGPRECKMPYKETSREYERLERVLKAEIIRLIRIGVSEFYTGGQTGVDELSALLILCIRDEIGTTANLHLVLPYEGMEQSFNRRQKDNHEWIKMRADTVTCLNRKYRPGCYRDRDRYMIDRSDYLVAVGAGGGRGGIRETVSMAKQKGRKIILIDPVTYRVTYD